MIQSPVAIALTLCERIIVEEKTHNVTLVNCLTRLRVRELPSLPLRLVFHAWLTDGLGTGKLRLVMRHPETLEEIWSQEVSAKFANPLQEFRRTLRRLLSFPVEGRYEFDLLADERSIAQLTVRVILEKESL